MWQTRIIPLTWLNFDLQNETTTLLLDTNQLSVQNHVLRSVRQHKEHLTTFAPSEYLDNDAEFVSGLDADDEFSPMDASSPVFRCCHGFPRNTWSKPIKVTGGGGCDTNQLSVQNHVLRSVRQHKEHLTTFAPSEYFDNDAEFVSGLDADDKFSPMDASSPVFRCCHGFPRNTWSKPIIVTGGGGCDTNQLSVQNHVLRSARQHKEHLTTFAPSEYLDNDAEFVSGLDADDEFSPMDASSPVFRCCHGFPPNTWSKPIIVTGGGGCGKSYTIRSIVNECLNI
ncbi:Hypothetical predicted protein [Paramuricea clavata]|uniref:Uncharacterized protein n=1 Tax=Paramuricea clavata TaxID=317549 RepID=A0A6S7JY64_PARCT|nr:Hypothetical predicted protein [Paramuricea clavata]